MISLPLVKRNTVQIIKIMVIFLAVLAMYSGVIVYMYTPSLNGMLIEYSKLFPGLMEAMGMSGAVSSLIEFMNMYLYGFLLILVPMIFIIVTGNILIMKYVDSGSIACLLASPNSRIKIIVTQAVSMIAGVILLMIFVTVFGITAAEIFFPGELDIRIYLLLNVSMLLTQLAVAGIVFLSACIFNESRNFYSMGAGLPLVFFLITMLGNSGDKLKFLKYMSLYTLFPSDMIIAGDSSAIWYDLVLAAIVTVLFCSGIYIFIKKDFSV